MIEFTKLEQEYMEHDKEAVQEVEARIKKTEQNCTPWMAAVDRDLMRGLEKIVFCFLILLGFIFTNRSIYEKNKALEEEIYRLSNDISALEAYADGQTERILQLEDEVLRLEADDIIQADQIDILCRETEILSNEVTKLWALIEDGVIPTQLNRTRGVAFFDGHVETWYNLDMSVVVSYARQRIAGMDDAEYWVREDGAKMLGDYVMVAANQEVHPYGSLVETSLGTGIVVDTGDFAILHREQIDIAVDWRG